MFYVEHVIAGPSRSKNGVASLAYPRHSVFQKMDARIKSAHDIRPSRATPAKSPLRHAPGVASVTTPRAIKLAAAD
jgi:hypothetical protein